MFVEKDAIGGTIKDVRDVENSGEKARHCVKVEEVWQKVKERCNEAKNLLYTRNPIGRNVWERISEPALFVSLTDKMPAR